MKNRIGIIGGGAWGTALAQVCARAGHEVRLWAREQEVCDRINQHHDNSLFLPGIALDPQIVASPSPDHLQSCAFVLLVCPAQFVRETLATLTLDAHATLIICAKGIEQHTGLLMSDVVHAAAPAHARAVLSGPSFAHEVAQGLPTGLTLACPDQDLGHHIIALLGQHHFRLYWSHDLIGAEIGGAVKNVLAIACGVAAGRGLGENAKATLMTRGFAEMLRFGVACGAQPQTLMGLCGFGDLVLTCASTRSRNMSLGIALGQGVPAAQALSGKRTVAEGAATAPVLVKTAQALGVDMPISEAVYDILTGADVEETIDRLLKRPVRAEGL